MKLWWFGTTNVSGSIHGAQGGAGVANEGFVAERVKAERRAFGGADWPSATLFTARLKPRPSEGCGVVGLVRDRETHVSEETVCAGLTALRRHSGV